MSLAREIAQHLNDDTWLHEAFEKMVTNLAKAPHNLHNLNKGMTDAWFKKNLGRPLHQGGVDKDILRNLRRTFRSVAHETLGRLAEVATV